MANSVVKFYRGLAASYNSITHVGGIYFATDTKKIIMNGTEYGGDSNKKVSNVALNANANGIVITYTDSTSTTLLLGKATVTADGLMSKEDKTKLDSLDLSGYYTKTQVDDAISTAKTELEAADTALEGQITTVTNQLNNKVDKVAGSSLISDTDLNQIRTNKSDIESLQTSVGGKQDELTPGNAVSITEENVIDVKLDPASNEALSKSAEGLKLDLSGVKGSTVKVGVAITGGAEIGADQTVAEGMKALSDSIKTAVAGGITSITSPDNTIKVTDEGTSRGLAVDMSKLVSTSSSIQIGTDGKLDIF
jgi:predicted pyridoxine 5'-phosphate oxidase superfamily flavin-nucleotide-binding protein